MNLQNIEAIKDGDSSEGSRSSSIKKIIFLPKADKNLRTTFDALHSTQLFGNFTTERTKHLLGLNRVDLLLMIGLLTGNGHFNLNSPFCQKKIIKVDFG